MSADLSPPLAALLELTHAVRCNAPIAPIRSKLERRQGRAVEAEWLRVMDEAQSSASCRCIFPRRARRCAATCRTGHPRPQDRALQQLITSGVTLDQPRTRSSRRPADRRADRSRRRPPDRSLHRQLSRRQGKKWPSPNGKEAELRLTINASSTGTTSRGSSA